MSKSVLISIRPKWCELIANGRKTVEVRKTRPKIEPPFRCYIYEMGDLFLKWQRDDLTPPVEYYGRGKQKVIGEFMCDDITGYRICVGIPAHLITEGRMTANEILRYSEGGKKDLYGWHISNLVIYDEPRELGEFYRLCDGLDDTGKCWECEKAVGDEHDCGINGRLPLTRPPQSWGYVEEETE